MFEQKIYAHANVAYKLSPITKSLMPKFLDPIERTQYAIEPTPRQENQNVMLKAIPITLFVMPPTNAAIKTPTADIPVKYVLDFHFPCDSKYTLSKAGKNLNGIIKSNSFTTTMLSSHFEFQIKRITSSEK